MTAAATAPRDTSRLLSRLLAFALVAVTILPLVIFATDATNGRLAREARSAALKRAGVTQLDDGTRNQRARASRARRHPGIGRVTGAMLLELFWIVVIAAAGRRLFALRL
jgi:hypothetical protein